MILETDKALLALLRTEILGDAPVAIAFDAPNRPWIQQVKGLMLNLYLYDIRENMQRREVMYTEIRDDKGKLVERRPPPRRYDLYYAVTVWAPKVTIEHQVLACVLAGLSEYETIPGAHLPETLAASGHVVLISVADGMKRGMFQNMGGELKTSLELVVTVPIFGKLPLPTAPAVSKPVALKMNGVGTGVGAERVEGKPAPAGAPAPAPAANGAAQAPAGAGPTAVREAQQREMVAAAKAAQAGGGAAPAGGGAAPAGAAGPAGRAGPPGATGPAKAAPGAPAGQQPARPPNPLALAQAALAQAAQSQALLAQAQAALVKVLTAATAPRQPAPAAQPAAQQPPAAAPPAPAAQQPPAAAGAPDSAGAPKPAVAPGAQNPAGAPKAAGPGAPIAAQKPAAKPAQGGGGGGGAQAEPEPEADSAPE